MRQHRGLARSRSWHSKTTSPRRWRSLPSGNDGYAHSLNVGLRVHDIHSDYGPDLHTDGHGGGLTRGGRATEWRSERSGLHFHSGSITRANRAGFAVGAGDGVSRADRYRDGTIFGQVFVRGGVTKLSKCKAPLPGVSRGSSLWTDERHWGARLC